MVILSFLSSVKLNKKLKKKKKIFVGQPTATNYNCFLMLYAGHTFPHYKGMQENAEP